MKHGIKVGLFGIALSVISSVIVPVVHGVSDEEGPLITNAVISPAGAIYPGDVISIVLTMYDPGGAGIRNTQFSLKDKFGRLKDPFNGMDCGSICTMYPMGSSVGEITFQFRVDETWGTNGFATLGSIRVFDKLTNGTYFYDDGRYENLQTRTMYAGKHPLDELRIPLGNPPSPPPSTISTSPSSTTTVPSSSTTSTSVAMSPSINSVTSFPLMKILSSASANSLARLAKLKVPSASKVTLRVKSGSAKYCKVSGTVLKGLKAGSCKVTVTVTPKKGRATSKTVTLKVTK